MEKILRNKSNEALIDIVESPNKYVKKLRKLAPLEIERRGISLEERKKIAKNIYSRKIKEMLTNALFSFDDFILPFSSILSFNQKSNLFNIEYDEFKFRRDSLNHGLGNYS